MLAYSTVADLRRWPPDLPRYKIARACVQSKIARPTTGIRTEGSSAGAREKVENQSTTSMSKLYVYPRDLHREYDEVVEKAFRAILESQPPITSWICKNVLPRWAWAFIGVRIRAKGIPPKYEAYGLGLLLANFEVEQE